MEVKLNAIGATQRWLELGIRETSTRCRCYCHGSCRLQLLPHIWPLDETRLPRRPPAACIAGSFQAIRAGWIGARAMHVQSRPSLMKLSAQIYMREAFTNGGNGKIGDV